MNAPGIYIASGGNTSMAQMVGDQALVDCPTLKTESSCKAGPSSCGLAASACCLWTDPPAPAPPGILPTSFKPSPTIYGGKLVDYTYVDPNTKL